MLEFERDRHLMFYNLSNLFFSNLSLWDISPRC